MPRKRQRYRRRPAPLARSNDGLEDQVLAEAARELVSGHTLEGLQLLLRQSCEAEEYADREAQQDPGEEALHRFREAARFHAQVERAVALAEASAEPG
jgi:hypothetical protein